MVNPIVVIATHHRVSITTRNIQSCLNNGCKVVLVVSSANEKKTFKTYFPDITIISKPNIPLGRKWQAGVDAARLLKADPLIINGSDDILNPEFYTRIKSLIESGYEFIGLKKWYVQHNSNVYLFDYLVPDFPLGGGRVYTGSLLERMNWELFDTHKERHLDDLGYWRMKHFGAKYILLDEPLILSVKGDWHCMNPVHKMLHSRNIKHVKTYSHDQILPSFKF